MVKLHLKVKLHQVLRKLLRLLEKSNRCKRLILKITIWKHRSCNRCKGFNRHGIEKDERSIAIERAEIESVQEDRKVEEEILNRNIKLRAIDLLNGQSINKQFKELKPGTTLNKNDFENLNLKTYGKFYQNKKF